MVGTEFSPNKSSHSAQIEEGDLFLRWFHHVVPASRSAPGLGGSPNHGWLPHMEPECDGISGQPWHATRRDHTWHKERRFGNPEVPKMWHFQWLLDAELGQVLDLDPGPALAALSTSHSCNKHHQMIMQQHVLGFKLSSSSGNGPTQEAALDSRHSPKVFQDSKNQRIHLIKIDRLVLVACSQRQKHQDPIEPNSSPI